MAGNDPPTRLPTEQANHIWKEGITRKLTTWLHWADQPDQSQTKIKQGTNKNHATGAKRGNTRRIQIDTSLRFLLRINLNTKDFS